MDYSGQIDEMVCTFDKGSNKVIIRRVESATGVVSVDIREHFRSDDGDAEEWRPTKKGIRIGSANIDDVIDALRKVKETL